MNMAENAPKEDCAVSENIVEEIKDLLWGSDIKHDVFKRWTQGER